MNLYVWKYVARVSDNYHSGGGLLCVASTLDEAREAILARLRESHVDQAEECGALSTPPDLSAETTLDPQVIVFPDAGCC